MGEIVGIHVYPLKSAKGIDVDEVSLTRIGVEGDRRWMLVDPGGRFFSQRRASRMALIEIALEGDHVRASAPGVEAIVFSLSDVTRELREVEIWGDRFEAPVARPDISAWFESYLGEPCSLVHLSSEVVRPIGEQYRVAPDDRVTFADSFPVHLTTPPSLDNLNVRLRQPVPMNRFRPNLVVDGFEPWAEDEWLEIEIGDVSFRVVKPCPRCLITTIDQDSGRAPSGREPLTTLSRFRRREGGIMFGQNLIPRGSGTLRIGDPVKIVETRQRENS